LSGRVGLGGFPGLLTGSTAVALVKQARCPVVVIRGRTEAGGPPSSGPVVVGVDHSEISDLAITVAFDEAAARGADLVVVRAWLWFTSDHAYDHARQLITTLDDLETQERESLADRLARERDKHPDVTVCTVLARPPGALPAGALHERTTARGPEEW
jgi:nucleotide-binding universal stress UspA family protein